MQPANPSIVKPIAGPKKPIELQSLLILVIDIIFRSLNQSAIVPTEIENNHKRIWGNEVIKPFCRIISITYNITPHKLVDSHEVSCLG